MLSYRSIFSAEWSLTLRLALRSITNSPRALRLAWWPKIMGLSSVIQKFGSVGLGDTSLSLDVLAYDGDN